MLGLVSLGNRAGKRESLIKSPKPTENVLTGLSVSRLIGATMVLESSPPLRNAPTGTSATICRFTAALNQLPGVRGRFLERDG